jgi:hypothetical protein
MAKFWFLREDETPLRSGLEEPVSKAHPRADKSTSAGRRGSPAWWPKAVLGLYIYTSVKISLCLYLQYNYDREYLRLRQMDHEEDPVLRVAPFKRKLDLNSTEYLTQKARMEHSRALVKSIGNPFSDMHVISLGCGLLLLSVTFAIYGNYLLLIKLRLVEPFDFYFLRLMLNESLELERCRRLVGSLVSKMDICSRNQILFWAAQLSAGSGFSSVRCRRSQRQTFRDMAARQLSIRDDMCREAESMIESGQLVVVNRTAAWADSMSARFSVIAVGVMANFTVFDNLLVFVMPHLMGNLALSSLMDVWVLLDVFLLICHSLVAAGLLLGLLGATCHAQKQYLSRLATKLSHCIEENDQDDCLRLSKRLNRNLMATLLEFEIFVGQFAPTRRSLPYIINCIATSLFVLCLIIRLHLPYVPPYLETLAIYFGLLMVVFADLILIPICEIHRLSTNLQKSMYSLTAQIVELDLRMLQTSGHRAFSMHLFWLQRNISQDSQQFINKFVAYGFNRSFKMSWLSLAKLHIILSLFILSTFFQANSWRMLAGDRIDDPLGLFIVEQSN